VYTASSDPTCPNLLTLNDFKGARLSVAKNASARMPVHDGHHGGCLFGSEHMIEEP
jgi:hypothetical protein